MNMPDICIVTDGTVQFQKPFFAGQNLLQIIPHNIRVNHQLVNQAQSYKATQLPTFANDSLNPRLLPPTSEEFTVIFSDLGKKYDHILGVFVSSSLSQCFLNAQEAAQGLRGRINIALIDSQTISIGLGYLVQAAAEAIAGGKPFDSIEQHIRSIIPKVYMIFCIPGLSYLYYNRFIDHEQAIISEMLGLYPIFTIEEGKFTPVEKGRNRHHTLDYFVEFLDEFENLQLISLLQCIPPGNSEMRVFRDHVIENFPKTPFSEHNINLQLAVLFGPKSVGLVVIEGD